MDKDVLEVILKKLDKDSRVASIIEIDWKPALPKGENYTSIISRGTLKVVLGNGRLSKKSFIAKQMITDGQRGEYITQYNIAKTETDIYTGVLQEMAYLMEEYEDTDDTFWCKLIHYDPKSYCIVLEDLKASGYSLVPRQKGLDLDHSLLVLNGLGRYHGMAKVLEERGLISKDNYKPQPLFTDRKLVKCIPYAAVRNVSKVMGESWGPGWEETAKKLKIPFDLFAEKWCNMGKISSETEFTVLNHGDCWSNNIMFKYDFQNRPIGVKFLDFQIPHYNSPCVDVTYFMYLGVQPALRRTNFDFLLKTYYDSLSKTLDKFGFAGRKPTYEEITNKMKSLEFYGLTYFTVLYPNLVCSTTEALDAEKLLLTDGEEGFNEDILREPGMVEKLGPDLIDFVEKHISKLK